MRDFGNKRNGKTKDEKKEEGRSRWTEITVRTIEKKERTGKNN